MTSREIRQNFLDFFKEKGHTIIPSASLIPDDKTVLFITAGMQPLVPYLLGRPHPQGKRFANAQKCLRTDDIMEVGDNRHLTFFEMLGNWSLGDYFKKESIEWSFELLTSKDRFGISPEKILVTVFGGDEEIKIGRDDESIAIWQDVFGKAGIKAPLGERIFAYPKNKNWWELAGPGPCGPDTEIFYDTGSEHNPAFGEQCHINCDCGKYVEIWNNVFMEYEKRADGKGGWIYAPLAQRNVDTGMGFERITMVLQGVETVFDTDLFAVPFAGLLDGGASSRIIADHLRASVFLLADGTRPSNKDAGYILRRLIRRLIVRARKSGVSSESIRSFIVKIIKFYGDAYSELKENQTAILEEFEREARQFAETLERGIKEFEKKYLAGCKISGREAFDLYQTYGFPFEVLKELAQEKNCRIDEAGFQKEFSAHQEISRAGAEKKFGGHGLVLQTGELKATDEEELKKVTRLHTVTHLLQAALRQVLGEYVRQRGSDITAERLRFDFSHLQKMTDEEKKKVEDLVNEYIKQALPVEMKEMTIEEAEKSGALMFQKEKYGVTVKVYSIGDISKELCGGPHVVNTGEIGAFKILKEEASSAGVRRIRANVWIPEIQTLIQSDKNEKGQGMAVPIAIVAAGAIIALTIFYKYGVSFNSNPINKGGINNSSQINTSKNDLNNIKPVSEKDHILGNLNVPIKIVEFSDTECPFCKKFHSTMKEIVKNYGDRVVWAYRHFPIEQLHPVKARAEAAALECANELGGSSVFWAYLDKLFEVTPSNNQLDQSLLPDIAESVGVNRAQFTTCATSDKYAARVSEDWQDAAMAGAEATPFTVVIAPNGKKHPIVGAQPYATVASVIDQALKEK